tara:strand:+ start:420 stop:533 length:114 start_codon:yes stop_codon:yes gene_type:complete
MPVIRVKEKRERKSFSIQPEFKMFSGKDSKKSTLIEE